MSEPTTDVETIRARLDANEHDPDVVGSSPNHRVSDPMEW